MERKLITSTKAFPSTKIAKRISKLSWQLVLLAGYCYLLSAQAQAQGTWTPLIHKAPDPNYGVMLLMTDGTVICHTSSGGSMGIGDIFDRLTPDSTGSYINGTWSQIAPMIRERYSFSSAVLKDGRVYAAGGEYGTDGVQAGSHGEVYDPATNTWTECNGPNQIMSDGDCKVLDNGTILQAIVDHPYPTSTVIYTPSTNTYTTGPSTLGGQNESMWLKLPDNTILFVNEGAQTSERYIPSLNQWIADDSVPVALYDPYGLECGPGLLLPDGRAFFIGGTNHTAIYTPSGTNSPGSWVAGPDVPNGRGMPDAPAAMMVNGKILFACSAQPTSSIEFATPTYFYEFDYLTNTYTLINAPTGAASLNVMSQQCNMLDLPDGSVLFGLNQSQTSNQYYIYTPNGAPLVSGKPVISDITPLTCTTYRITGHGFNGISEGSAFGDENENDNNYPIIRFSSGGKVYYARSYNWNSTGVQRDSASDTAYFSLPSGMQDGVYSLVVVATGNASDPVSFIDSIPTLSSPLTTSVCSGSPFTYTPASTTNGATFTWTRASVTGISNAAITTPQSANPNEVLINTAGVPVTVVYAYSVTSNSCSNTLNVSVVVNPLPAPTFTALPTTACYLPAIISFANTTTSGGNYIWNFGDGNTSTNQNPTHSYTIAGTYSVKLISTNACGIDSITRSNYIVVNPPSRPVVTSPVNISCGGSTTLNATGSDTLQWYNQPTGGTLLGTGGSYVTPALNTNTTYYVESYISSAPDFCPPLTDAFGSGNSFTNSTFRSEFFNVNQQCTLVSVLVYSSSAGSREIDLEDSSGNILQSKIVNIPNGTNTVTLNFPLTVGKNFQLGCGDGSTNTNLYRNSSGASYPYSDPNDYISITGNNVPDGERFYFFYDWQLQGACISSRAPVDVIINGGPTSSFSYAENLNVVNFTNTSSGSTSWLWNFGDGDTSTSQNPVHTFGATGTYTVTLTAYNSGCFDTITRVVTILALGINPIDITSALSIFPNPTNGLVTISAAFNSTEQIEVIVKNTIGEIIYETTPILSSHQQFNLDLQHESKGIYFVQLKTSKGFVVRKLVLN